MKLVQGKVYILAGRGELLCVNAEQRRFVAHGGDPNTASGYWATEAEIVRQAFREDLDRRHEQAVPRGVDCRDPECWCRNKNIEHEPKKGKA